MSEQYLRQATLIVTPEDAPGIDMSELHFKFIVKRGDIQTPNSIDVRVYNVSPETANKIASRKPESEFTRLILQAGYGNDLGVLFDGTIKQVRRGRESATDTYLDITAADGDRAYNYAYIATSLAAGSTANDHINAAVNAMSPAPYGITKGYIPPLPDNKLPRGKVMFGMARDAVRQVASTTRNNWSIQNGQLQLVPLDAYIFDQAVVLNSKTGLIGQPELTQNGVQVRALINTKFVPGKPIQLDQKSVNLLRVGLSLQDEVNAGFIPEVPSDGIYRILYAEHMGDTRGNEWYSDLVCLAINGALTPSVINKTAVAPAGSVRPYG